MLKRSGSEWSAWVNGIQRGTTLTLSPTLTATKVEMAMGHWALWNERDIEVDNLTVIPEPATILLLTLGGLALRKYRR